MIRVNLHDVKTHVPLMVGRRFAGIIRALTGVSGKRLTWKRLKFIPLKVIPMSWVDQMIAISVPIVALLAGVCLVASTVAGVIFTPDCISHCA